MATNVTRFNVRCTICNDVFNNDYTARHTKSKHKDLAASGRTAPTSVIVENDSKQKKMDAFFQSKKRKVEKTSDETHEMIDFESEEEIQDNSHPNHEIHSSMLVNENTSETQLNNDSDNDDEANAQEVEDEVDPAGLSAKGTIS